MPLDLQTASSDPLIDLEPVEAQGPPSWSILSEVVSYSPTLSPDLHVEAIQPGCGNGSEPRDLPAGTESVPPTPDQVSNELHFRPYKGIRVELSTAVGHDENVDVSTTFIGLVQDDDNESQYQPEQSFRFDARSCTQGSLPNGEKFKILIDTGASRSYLSYAFYLECEYLRALPRHKPMGSRVYMGNGDWVPAQFIIPIIFHVGNCAFEVYTLVCKTSTSDFIWGMKNIVETEGVICTHSMEYRFLNRSPKLFCKMPISLPPDGSQHILQLGIEFPCEVSGQAIVKLLLAPKKSLHTIKVPIRRNSLTIWVSNHSKEAIKHPAGSIIGLVDIRSLGYFHVGLEQLKRNILKEYDFKSIQNLNYQLNKMIDVANIRNRRHRGISPNDPYPWLEPSDPRQSLSDDQILDRTIDLSNSRLSSSKKRRLMAMLKHYKKAFSLRDELGECPNVTLNIDVIDDCPFFVRPFPITEKDKPLMDRQMD